MNELMQALTTISAGAAGALFSAIWEGALLALLVYGFLRLIPGLSAAARSVVWLNVFILLALLHLFGLFAAPNSAPAALTGHALRLDPRWSLALAALWLALSLARAGQLAAGALHLRRLARRAVPVDLTPELEALLTIADRRVRLCASEQVVRPSVLGFFRPSILLPPALLERLSPAELRQVVVHEMEHLRRGDDWTNLLQKLALVLFPLNPALAWVERRVCAERELACDDSVLRCGAGRKAYALCLAHLAEYSLMRRGFSLLLGAWERRPELVRRVHRILREPAHNLSRRTAFAVTGGLVAGALGCALVLVHAPQVVMFAPAAHAEQAATASLDARATGGALGATPHLVKAVLPRDSYPQPARSSLGRSAGARHAARKPAPAVRLANLRTPPPSQAATLLVMTEWTDEQPEPDMVITVLHAQPDHPKAIVPASFAVVRTPAGWLVIEI